MKTLTRTDLLQFKGKDLNSKTAGEYAMLRLGLDPTEWVCTEWAACVEYFTHGAFNDDAEEFGIHNHTEIVENINDYINSDVLPKNQMIVTVTKAKSLKEAQNTYKAGEKLEEKRCFIDWQLVQVLCNE